MSISLSLKEVTYKNILKNVTFDLKANTFNILVGPNGCGKSTIINCIFNQVKYSGTIYVSDYKKLKLMEQSLVLLENLPIDNITKAFENAGYSLKESRKKAYDISKRLGITELLFKKVSLLTASELKVIKFACAASGDPKILIIDDPINIKNKYREKIIKYLKKVSKECTVLFITNDENDLLYADNIILMKEGSIVDFDTRDEILSKEKLLQKCKMALPFVYNLSEKLKTYELIEKNYYDYDSLIGAIWK